MSKSIPRKGQRYKAWFTGTNKDGTSTITKVRKYDGVYPKFFRYFVTLTALNTSSGLVEMAWE
jgi:hypothetical protein